MSVKLYKADVSPAGRAAMMACDLFQVPVKMVDVNLMTGEHMSPEFLKKNPLHTVPVLEDGSVTIIDSHAILMYLADTYGKNDAAYPKDTKQRALVNQRLFFDCAVLFNRLRNVSVPAFVEGQREVSEAKLKDIEEAYGFVEEFLIRTKFVATNQLTIADLSVSATLSSLSLILPHDAKKYPQTDAWLKEMQKQPFYKKYNEPGLNEYGELLRKILDL